MLNNSMALLHVSHHPVQTYRVRTSYIFNIAWTLWALDPITNPSFGRAPAAPCYNKTSSWFLNRNTASQVSMARNIPTNEKQRWATKTTLPIKSLNCNGWWNKEFPRQKKAKRILLPETSIAGDTKGTAVWRGRKRARERGTHVQMGKMSKYLSIITLNVNGLNAPIKTHRVGELTWKMTHTYTS